MKKLTVIDLFCGAGGFSEGFRQAGFDIIMGIDSWHPAIATFNHNFGLDCKTKNILDFENSIDEIEELPDTDVIIGSPPCVTFSHSNNSGKADKGSGILLTKVFLRIVAIKKFKKNSILKAWFMENVTNSKEHLYDQYTFKELGLKRWAIDNDQDPDQIAIVLKDHQVIVNATDYGCPQKRKRVISGEVIEGQLRRPEIKDPISADVAGKNKDITLATIKDGLPKPNEKKNERIIKDPLYPDIKIKTSDLTDHFYDTGLYENEWKQSKYWKTNHPYMGRMSFPENEDQPSRTITATKIGVAREALIYRSEFNRKGDGEYRTPTIREAACIMGFPITYQFKGSEGTKWRLVGNAVCPPVSRAFAQQLRVELGMDPMFTFHVTNQVNLEDINNLNTYSTKEFNNSPTRAKNSRFRRHPFKYGNMTVTLSNYDIKKNNKCGRRWITSVQYGSGDGFPTFNYTDKKITKIEAEIKKLEHGIKFIEIINNGFTAKIATANELQRIYEQQKSEGQYLGPIELVEEVATIIENLIIKENELYENKAVIFKKKKAVPIKQLFALYAINKICLITNKE
ncbi:MAG: DNA cytosine methyltransferase [Ignavibacteria bacterium CG_4_9_14_3_um_filter_36_18]|nr:MAG: DNA cytosine methyltransferase [Ignavibacteria bacterium CG_4_9_14_3_um_filter_36_18]